MDSAVQPTHGTVRAWDLPTRVFHWTLVLLVISSYLSFRFAERIGDPTMMWHRFNGYAILILVVWRLGWGIWGSPTSRFTRFIKSPGKAMSYGLSLVGGKSPHYLGHNPLGAYMILALLATLAVQSVLGLLTEEHNQTTWGPLYFFIAEENRKSVAHWHSRVFYYALLVLIAAHVLANVLYGVIKKDPLIRAMATGSKPARQPDDGYIDEPDGLTRPRSVWSALLWLAISAAIVLGSIKALGGKLIY